MVQIGKPQKCIKWHFIKNTGGRTRVTKTGLRYFSPTSETKQKKNNKKQ